MKKKQDLVNEKQQELRESQEEVIQLKRCLYFLIKVNNIFHDFTLLDSNSQDKLFFCKKLLKLLDKFLESEFEVQWLTEPNFDENVEILVYAFQHKFNLRVDGIVGINTLLTLERCLTYRVLSEEEHDFLRNSLLADQTKLQRIRQQEIFKLKKCLLSLLDLDFLSKENAFSLQEVRSWNDCETKPKFDEKTKFLVKQFQEKLGLFSDGVVRYDTLVKLNGYIANLNKSDPDLSYQDNNSRNTEPDNPARLVTVSSLIPSEIFEALVDKLFDSFNLGDQLSLDENTLAKLVSPVEGINDFEDVDLKKEIKDEKINFSRNDLVNIIMNQFIVTDSIIAVVLILISPLIENSLAA